MGVLLEQRRGEGLLAGALRRTDSNLKGDLGVVNADAPTFVIIRAGVLVPQGCEKAHGSGRTMECFFELVLQRRKRPVFDFYDV